MTFIYQGSFQINYSSSD